MQGLLRIDITQNAVLKLTEAARPILKQDKNLQLAVPRLSSDLTKKATVEGRNYDRALFAKLKHLRKSIAEQEDVPPFVVFSDATLADMAGSLPDSSSEFLQVNGVGKTKLTRYGEKFLATIARHLTS